MLKIYITYMCTTPLLKSYPKNLWDDEFDITLSLYVHYNYEQIFQIFKLLFYISNIQYLCSL